MRSRAVHCREIFTQINHVVEMSILRLCRHTSDQWRHSCGVWRHIARGEQFDSYEEMCAFCLEEFASPLTWFLLQFHACQLSRLRDRRHSCAQVEFGDKNTSQHATETGTRLSGIQRIKTNLVLWSELLHFVKNFTKNGALAWVESDTSCVVTVLAYRWRHRNGGSGLTEIHDPLHCSVGMAILMMMHRPLRPTYLSRNLISAFYPLCCRLTGKLEGTC